MAIDLLLAHDVKVYSNLSVSRRSAGILVLGVSVQSLFCGQAKCFSLRDPLVRLIKASHMLVGRCFSAAVRLSLCSCRVLARECAVSCRGNNANHRNPYNSPHPIVVPTRADKPAKHML